MYEKDALIWHSARQLKGDQDRGKSHHFLHRPFGGPWALLRSRAT